MGVFKQINELELCEYFKNNISKSALAKKYNINRETVRNILKRHNLFENNIDEVEICKNYIDNMSKIEISQNHNLHVNTIIKILKKHNLLKISNIYTIDKLNIVRDYEDGLSKSRIMKKYDICRDSVNLILKNNNIKSKGGKVSRKNYKVNERFFEKIDTKEKAYILGFLYADGCLSQQKKSSLILTLSLQKCDSYILDNINKIIEHNRPLLEDRGQRKLVITSDKIGNDVIKAGVVIKKTWVLNYPFFIDKKFQGHFIRGYFDGDGCINIRKSDACALWYICGALSFCYEIQTYLKSVGIESNVYEKKNYSQPFGNVMITDFANLKKIYNFMYKDCDDLYLIRKKEKFEQIKYKTMGSLL